jgi:riboflavin kinase/FMN adenylyltransferase
MQILRTFEQLPPQSNLAIGVFDGVHLGHQRVIAAARDAGSPSVVLTFDPHPMRVLQPDKAPLLLTSTPHKLRLLETLGVDACLLVTFDKKFSETPAEKFVERIAGCRQVCVGSRFRFGHERRGDVALLQTLAPRHGFSVREIPSVLTADGEMISSTAVRQHVRAGRLDRAAAMLGRLFSILGTVEHGDHRGKQIGFPTANLNPHNEVLPPHGVYAARVKLLERASSPFAAATHGRDARSTAQTLGGVVNVGVRPTFGSTEPTLEVHLLDFNGDLYGQDLEVEFVKKLRDERKFDSVEALQRQIAADIAAARLLL